jgi:hypothetical protein
MRIRHKLPESIKEAVIMIHFLNGCLFAAVLMNGGLDRERANRWR